MSLSLSLSSSRLSSYSGGVARAGAGAGAGARLGLGLGGGAGAGLGLGLGLGAGPGAGFGFGAGAGAGLGLGLGAGAGLGFGAGAGAGLGLGGGGSAGALIASPAFAMGRTIASGGLSAGAALAAGSALGPALPRVLSREAEKSTLSGLNDRFSAYVAKVRSLQQENIALEAKLSQLTGGADMSPEASSTATVEYEAQLSEYRGTLQALTFDTIKLEIELDNVRGAAHEFKAKLDFEQGVKFQLEFDIAAMKKDIEAASDLRIDLDAKYASLKSELDFVTKTQEEELSTLQSKLGSTAMDTSVSMIEVDTGRSFDIAAALNKMRMEYEKSVQQHRDEAETYYKLKMDEIQSANAQSSEAVSAAKVEITAAKKELQTLGIELQGLITQNMTFEQSLVEANAQTSVGVAEYQAQIASLTSAIEGAKAELQKQIIAYQELLDVKLALDVEISTYRKLLEGDDFKLPDFTETSYTFSVKGAASWGGGGGRGPLSPALFHLVGGALPQTSTPQDSPPAHAEIHTRYIRTAGGKGIQIKEIITEHIETSVVSDDAESS